MYCHKHGQGLATGRCEKCDDEVISLGIQADKDRIALLEDALKDARSALLYVRETYEMKKEELVKVLDEYVEALRRVEAERDVLQKEVLRLKYPDADPFELDLLNKT